MLAVQDTTPLPSPLAALPSSISLDRDDCFVSFFDESAKFLKDSLVLVKGLEWEVSQSDAESGVRNDVDLDAEERLLNDLVKIVRLSFFHLVHFLQGFQKENRHYPSWRKPT